jgi:acetate kinase
MYLLTINAGSSSIKLDLFNYKDLKLVKSVQFDRVRSYDKAFKDALKELQIDDTKKIKVVAHRVVHGGEKYSETTVITKWVEDAIEKLSKLAPLHNPVNLKAIKAAKKIFHCPHFAVFDTAFHQSIPEKAFLYGIPLKYYKDDGVRKYGFHGINHEYMYNHARSQTRKKTINVITCHLGNGTSVTAIENGKVIDTSMGFTPLEGAIMGTRSGSIDPAIPYYLKSRYGRLNTEKMLQEKAGLLGLSDNSSDMRDIREKALKDNKKALTALEVYSYSISKYIGMYYTILGDVDYIIFSGGIGENATYTRKKVIKNLKGISAKTKILKLNANEALQMAKNVKEKLEK